MKTYEQVQAHAKERGHELMPVEIDLVIDGETFHEELLVSYVVDSWMNTSIIEDYWMLGRYGRYGGFPFIRFGIDRAVERYIRKALNMGDKEGVDPDEAFETDHADRNRDLRRDQV